MDRRWVARVSSAGMSAILLASACSSGDGSDMLNGVTAQQNAEAAVFPSSNWTRANPAELGFDAAALEQIAGSAGAETSCLVVTRHGEVAGEWYWNGAGADLPQGAFSVTQAFSATLVGIAQDQGLLDIDDRVADYIPEWDGTPSEDVTIRDILSHVSGRESTNSIGNMDLYNQLLTSPNPGIFAEGLPQEHPPGGVWSQNLPAIELLNPILTAATGEDPAAFAQENLFGPIGATHTRYTQNNNGVTWMHAFMETTCEDAARLGYLLLRHGDWHGTQVLSEDWVDEATNPSQDLNAGFGYMLWLNHPGSLVSIDNVRTPDYDEPSDEQLVPDAPEDMFWAIGLGGQIIQVDPETDTVVVRLGTPDGDEATNMQLVTRMVTEGLTQ